MGRIIKYQRSVIPSCDVKLIGEFRRLIEQTCDVEGIGGYKVGSILTLRYGLPTLVKVVREFTDLPVIYDHQKAMTDIHDLGRDFAEVVKESGVDALIGFPQSGPATQETWIKACKDVGLEVVIGGEMTHPKYKRSDGGYIADEALDEIYLLAARLGVNNFVVPGTKVERIIHYRSILQHIVQGDLTLFIPGLITQGGIITDVARVAGDSWHAIVGRAIYGTKDFHAAAGELTRQLFK
ncbi:MAG: orotidine 5-phosphate decarboxylase [Candidatus Bathyarchaeia archaeon]